MTRLVEEREDSAVYTSRRETDARMALARGLAEYLSQIEHAFEGKVVRFVQVFDAHAVPENDARYPSAAVLFDGEGQYADDDALSGHTEMLNDGNALRFASEYSCTLVIAAWCTDPVQRTAVSMLLEDALAPVEWRSGFVLDLPHYHGARGQYALVSASDDDSEETARERARALVVKLRASVPHLVLDGPKRRLTFRAARAT